MATKIRNIYTFNIMKLTRLRFNKTLDNYRRWESVLCALPSFIQRPILAFMLLLDHKPYAAITGLYWNIADHLDNPEYWWDIQTKYKTANWD